MPIPEQFIGELVARSETSDMVSFYIHLTRRGNNPWGLCPSHNEETSSFSVSPNKQICHRFGCDKGGGVISFIMEVENLLFPDVVRLLAQRAELEALNAGADDAGRKKRARALAANRDAVRLYHDYFEGFDSAWVRDYLAQRQIVPCTATCFGLGAAPEQWDTLTRALAVEGYSKVRLINVGLAVTGKDGSVYDKFRARLVLPVINVRGGMADFISHILPEEEGAKYLNIPETIAFKKGRPIYALDFIKSTKQPNLVLAEGNIDVVILHQTGLDDVVTTMSTALAEGRVRILARYIKKPMLCYDNDVAGKQSIDRVLNILKNASLSVRVSQLPDVYDAEEKSVKQNPDDFVRKLSLAAFEKCLNGSAGRNDYRLETPQQKYSLADEEGRMTFLKEAVETVAAFQSPIGRETYGNKTAATAGIPAGAFIREAKRLRKNRA